MSRLDGDRKGKLIAISSGGKSAVMSEEYILDLADRVARLEENVNWIKKLTTGTFLTTIAIIISLMALIVRLFMG